VGWVGEIWM